MRWEVRIEGPSALLHQLALAISDRDIRLVDRNGTFILCGARLDALHNAASVLREAERIVTLLSVAARLSLGSRAQLRVPDAAVACAAPRGHGPAAHSPETARILNGPGVSIHWSPAPAAWSRRSSLSRSLRDALANPTLEKALRLRNGGELNWPDLIRVYRLIEEAAGGRPTLSAFGGATEAAINQLLQTAKSLTAAEGAAARGRGSQRPANPMTIDEARSFVDRLLAAWMVKGTRRRARRRHPLSSH